MNRILTIIIIAIIIGVVSAVALKMTGFDEQLSPGVIGGLIGGIVGAMCAVLLRKNNTTS